MRWPPARRMPAPAIIVMLGGMAAAAQAPARTTIASVGFEGDACARPLAASPCVVLIEADGPLPEPSGGVLTNPDRVYLDFSGTRARTSGVPHSGASRQGIRVAVHSDAPLVTRVVIDLAAPASYTLDLSHRAQGQLRLQLRAAARAASSAPSDARAASTPRGTPPATVRTPPPAYGERIQEIFDALERMRADLSLLDHRSMPSVDSLRNDTMQLSAVRVTLGSLKPPAALASPHASLQSACGLAALALESAAKSPQGNVTPEIASAAAGAVILFDRARAALSSAR